MFSYWDIGVAKMPDTNKFSLILIHLVNLSKVNLLFTDGQRV